jgi:hypothetical protein
MPFVLGEEDFHRIKVRKTLIRSYSDLNTNNNAGPTESFSVYAELYNSCGNLNFCF